MGSGDEASSEGLGTRLAGGPGDEASSGAWGRG